MASDPGILGRAGGGQPRRGRRVIQKGSFPTSRLRSLRDPSDRNLTRRCLLHLHSGSNDRVTPIACNETFRESNHPVCSPCERPETFHFPPTPPSPPLPSIPPILSRRAARNPHLRRACRDEQKGSISIVRVWC